MLTEIADGVLVHQSAVLRNNSVVVTGPEGVLLVDAGITGAEMTCLADDLRRRGLTVVVGFATHPDWDHVLWHHALGEAPRYGTARCAEVMRQVRSHPDWRAREAAGLPEEIAEETPLDLYGLLDPLPAGASHLPWNGSPVRVVEHPAHSPGHAALVVEERGVLVAGDMLSDVFVPMLDDVADGNDPVAEYREGLALLEAAAQEITVAVPGHGSVARDAQVHARIRRDRAYLDALLDGSDPDDPRLTSPEPGWEWVSAIHDGQARSVAARRA